MRTQTLLMLTITIAATAPASAQWPTTAPRADVERAMRDAERALRQVPRIAAIVSPYARGRWSGRWPMPSARSR